MSALHCLFCGGADCKYENWLNWLHDSDHPNALDGLYSNWINNEIIAMQRPSTRLIKIFDIIAQFKELGIKAVFNLQIPGEHKKCGDGIEYESKFAYLPEIFMDNLILYFNFGWTDMNVPSFDIAIRMAQVMAHVIENEGKVAVHCHAGLGTYLFHCVCSLRESQQLVKEEPESL